MWARSPVGTLIIFKLFLFRHSGRQRSGSRVEFRYSSNVLKLRNSVKCALTYSISSSFTLTSSTLQYRENNNKENLSKFSVHTKYLRLICGTVFPYFFAIATNSGESILGGGEKEAAFDGNRDPNGVYPIMTIPCFLVYSRRQSCCMLRFTWWKILKTIYFNKC